MKSLLVLSVFLVLVVGMNFAYAEINELNIETHNERTDIHGTGTPGTELFLRVWDDSGNLVLDGFDYNDMRGYNGIDTGGDYRIHLFPKYVGGNMGDFTGELMNEGKITKFEFSIKTTHFEENPIPGTADIQIDNKGKIEMASQSAYDELSQQNERLQQENTELKVENKRLKNKIEQLKDEIIKMQEDFFLTIKEQLNYFMSVTEK